MGYFENTYRHVNNLSPEGRRSHWRYFDLTIGRWLPPASRHARVLDIGCGAGLVLEWLQARGYPNVIGVDIDPGQVEFAQGIGTPAHRSSDIVEWMTHQRRSDFIILKDVLEHIDNQSATSLLKAISRNLAPGGRAYISVPNANASFASRWRYNDPTHRRSYTEISLRAVLSEAGLRAECTCGDDVWATRSILGHCQQALKRAFRAFRRLEASAEFGAAGWNMPLSLNLVAIASMEPR